MEWKPRVPNPIPIKSSDSDELKIGQNKTVASMVLFHVEIDLGKDLPDSLRVSGSG